VPCGVLGPVRGGKAEIGLEFTAPRPTFWRVAFPPEDWTARSPEAARFPQSLRQIAHVPSARRSFRFGSSSNSA